MNTAPEEQLETGLHDAALLFKALGDPTRIRMLAVLRHGELCVCDIMEVLQLPQSTASRHLAYLRNAGWVSARRRNKWMYYRLSTGSPDRAFSESVLTYLTTIDLLNEDFAAMARHLARKNPHSCSQP